MFFLQRNTSEIFKKKSVELNFLCVRHSSTSSSRLKLNLRARQTSSSAENRMGKIRVKAQI